MTPDEFFEYLGERFEPQDHHLTGPEALRLPEGHGSVYHVEGRILATLARRLGGPILEIGTDAAISTRYLHEGLEENGAPGRIYTVDPNQRWTYTDDWPRIVPFSCPSRLWIPLPCKWAFIDGDHRYYGVKHDIALAGRCGCRWILLHDTGPNQHLNPESPTSGSDARRAALDSFETPPWDLLEIDTPCGLMFAQALPLLKGKP